MTTKITRSQIKSIVKECLVEILQEGLGNLLTPGPQQMTNDYDSVPHQMSMNNRNQFESRRQRSAALDTPVSSAKSSLMKEIIKNESRGSSIMEDILSDTAAKTLPQMMSGDEKSKILSLVSLD